MTGVEIKAIFAAILVAFGVAAPIPEFLAGMVIAIGGCYAVMIVTEPTSRLSVWATLFLGVVGALFAAILHQHIGWVDDIPLQAVMGTAGALSKFLAEAMISFGQGLKDWAGKLPSAWKFPGGDSK